jgi:3-hydroxybutyryl-CoA dehydrogenase
MKKIVVIGAGTMGNGIAHPAAAAGLDVTLIDVGQEILERAMTTIGKNLQRAVDKGKLSAGDKEAIVGRIRPSTDEQKIGDADIVIEAIIEPSLCRAKRGIYLAAAPNGICRCAPVDPSLRSG